MAMNLGFLASHNGSNMQSVIDACKTGRLKAVPAIVISNNSDSGALARAEREGIPHLHLSTKTHPDAEALDAAILQVLRDHDVELVVLAGYMRKVGTQTLRHYTDRIINIHPALLPKFGGQGMFGLHVHQAVLAAGETETGVTIHLVNDEYDRGQILGQRKVAVLPTDTVETLAARVLETEHAFLVETLQKIIHGEISLPNIL